MSLELVNIILKTLNITIKSNKVSCYALKKIVILGNYYNIEKVL